MQQSVSAVVLSTDTPPLGPPSTTAQLPVALERDSTYLKYVLPFVGLVIPSGTHGAPASRVAVGVPVHPVFVKPSMYPSSGQDAGPHAHPQERVSVTEAPTRCCSVNSVPVGQVLTPDW
jgi:hypothetical protein